MKSYDLSHKLNNITPVYPGTEQPNFTQFATIESKGYRETKMCFHSHLGTHIDAPAHMIKDGKSLDDLKIENFIGPAIIISIPKETKTISKELIAVYSEELSNIEFVLFKTGWSDYWGDEKYFRDFPVLTSDATDYLCKFKLKGIGFDAISADPVESTNYENHYKILGNNLLIIENLNFPLLFNEEKGNFFCFPLYYERADGSPVRAVLTKD